MVEAEIKTIGLKESERQRCEIWTSVMGYHRPVSEFNPGKKGEHDERAHFVEPAGCKLQAAVCRARKGPKDTVRFPKIPPAFRAHCHLLRAAVRKIR